MIKVMNKHYYIRKSQKHFDNGYRRFVTSEGQMLIF